jgi:hypothetical protein
MSTIFSYTTLYGEHSPHYNNIVTFARETSTVDRGTHFLNRIASAPHFLSA